MVSTITTSVTSITSVTTTTTTSAVAVATEIADFSLMTTLTMIAFLCIQEVIAGGDSLLLRRLSRTANTAVVPLLYALGVTVAIRMALYLS